MADDAPALDPAAFVRDEAAKGARAAVMPWIALALALGAIAVWRTRRR